MIFSIPFTKKLSTVSAESQTETQRQISLVLSDRKPENSLLCTITVLTKNNCAPVAIAHNVCEALFAICDFTPDAVFVKHVKTPDNKISISIGTLGR